MPEEGQQCLYCDGFYGLAFGQYVCATCHLFLFPEEPAQQPCGSLTAQRSDSDSDSGNEEPPDLLTMSSCSGGRRRWRSAAAAAAVAAAAAAVGPEPGRLAERLQRLSVAHPGDAPHSGSLAQLPPEVLLVILRHLDDLALWAAAGVCRRWRHLVLSHVPEHQWRRYIQLRFPLFRAIYRVENWSYIYSKLVESAPCLQCLTQMSSDGGAGAPEEGSSFRRRRLVHEENALQSDPPEGIRAAPLDSTYSHWQASITGPAGSPYEGGVFLLYLQVPSSYPLQPPVVRFITKVFHPNVSRHGDIGIDSIHHNWTLALTLVKVLISIQSLLTDPYCNVCMEPSVGALYQRDWPQFVEQARAWTWRYAMHDALLPEPARPPPPPC